MRPAYRDRVDARHAAEARRNAERYVACLYATEEPLEFFPIDFSGYGKDAKPCPQCGLPMDAHKVIEEERDGNWFQQTTCPNGASHGYGQEQFASIRARSTKDRSS